MPCSKVSINKNYKCDKATCICIPTGGKPCICICENENGDIMQCDDCKCDNSDNCQCKCDDSKCTCIVTKGASCICVCRNARGNIKSCDCACTELEEARTCSKKDRSVKPKCCSKKLEKETCGTNCACDKKRTLQVRHRDATVYKNYNCGQDGCICIPTGGKPCICICENENGDIMRCDDCKCDNYDNCQCKCDDSKCTCIVTKGASCICVCRDTKGNIKSCDCACTELEEARTCCKKDRSVKPCEYRSKKFEKETCGTNCTCDGKINLPVRRRGTTVYKNYNCGQDGCICIPTGGKPCICICENENGDIMKCDDCKCDKYDNCQCKCDDSKCTCIVTKGASCICVCRDTKGNIRSCDCACTELEGARTCCKKDSAVKPNECRSKKLETETCGTNCACDRRRTLQGRQRDTAVYKNYNCNQAGCVCIPTSGKPCICVCEDENGGIIRCDDCKCYSDNCQCKCDDLKCTCIVTKGASCICVCRDTKGNIKSCDCACTELEEARTCCKKDSAVKPNECRSKKLETETCGTNCACDRKRTLQVRQRNATLYKTYNCGQDGCICIPTGGKPCICICDNENGDIMICDDCKCDNSDNCQCKCDDSKCTCIVTKGAICICVCRDTKGNIKSCDCACTELEEARTCCKKDSAVKPNECRNKKLETETCGTNCACDRKRTLQGRQRDTAVYKNYNCNQAGCVCIPTGGKPCICVCEDQNGSIIRCDDCKCYSDNCQCKCDDSKCTCIVTKGASCICGCRDARGNIKSCDCTCTELEEARTCCKKDSALKPCECRSKKLEKETCVTKCACDRKRTLKIRQRDATLYKNYNCGQVGCICIPTGGKPCICICENENGDIMRCDDCKCDNYDNCQCKCDDSKCTCIVTNGASCICVCRDARGNIKSCYCACNEIKEAKTCCKKGHSVQPCKCHYKKLQKETSGTNCACDGKRNSQVRRRDTTIYNCDQTGCVCIPTGGKPCICVCEDDNGGIIRCDDCKCYSDNCQCKCDDSKCTCIVTKGASCICVCRDASGNFNSCDCSCTEAEEVRPSGKKEVSVKFCDCCNKKLNKETCEMYCKCDGKRNLQVPRPDATITKNYNYGPACCYNPENQSLACQCCGKKDNAFVKNTCIGNNIKTIEPSKECPCAPTEKSCICICESKGDLIYCSDCQCDDKKDCNRDNCLCIARKNHSDRAGSVTKKTTCPCINCNQNDIKLCKRDKPSGSRFVKTCEGRRMTTYEAAHRTCSCMTCYNKTNAKCCEVTASDYCNRN